MDWSNIIIVVCSALGTVLSLVAILNRKFERMDRKFDDIQKDIRQIDNRISRFEGIFEGIFFESKKTGSGDKKG